MGQLALRAIVVLVTDDSMVFIWCVLPMDAILIDQWKLM